MTHACLLLNVICILQVVNISYALINKYLLQLWNTNVNEIFIAFDAASCPMQFKHTNMLLMFLAGRFSAASISLLCFAGIALGIFVSMPKVCIMTMHFAAEEPGSSKTVHIAVLHLTLFI